MKLLYSAVDTFPPKAVAKTYEARGTIGFHRLGDDNLQVVPLALERVTFGKEEIRVWLDRSTVKNIELTGTIEVRKPRGRKSGEVDIFVLRAEHSSVKFKEGPGIYEFESVE